MKQRSAALLFFLLIFSIQPSKAGPIWDELSESEIQILHRILDHWETWVPQKKAEGSAPMITFEELYAGLEEESVRFLDRIRAIDPQKDFDFQGGYFGTETGDVDFVRLDHQTIQKDGKPYPLPPQYVPKDVYEAYESMMKAMQDELGKRLYVESGYRSPAYQLYVFLYYTPGHDYSLVETGHWVALPGYSEHGAVQVQALDFINEEGINGDDEGQTVEDFEALPEYQWLEKNADRYGFVLSYPRNQKGITFEPWHWRYQK